MSDCDEPEPTPMTKDEIKVGGIQNKLREKNWEKINAENEISRILTLIFEKGNEELIRATMEGRTIIVKYKALKGKYKNKKGVESDCWESIWGKYAGSCLRQKEPPTLNFYIPYIEEDFDFDSTGRGYGKLKYNKSTATKHGRTIEIVK